jgi:hypothetical protein
MTVSAFVVRSREHAVLLGEDREHLVGLAQRRAGAADRVVEVLLVAGDARCRARRG